MGADIAGFQAKTEQLMADQIAMQTATLDYQQQSTNEKNKFDCESSAIQKQSSCGEAVAKLTDKQSDQIAQ